MAPTESTDGPPRPFGTPAPTRDGLASVGNMMECFDF
jgi:hypothetical protein